MTYLKKFYKHFFIFAVYYSFLITFFCAMFSNIFVLIIYFHSNIFLLAPVNFTSLLS